MFVINQAVLMDSLRCGTRSRANYGRIWNINERMS
jgi:hypothetical protein